MYFLFLLFFDFATEKKRNSTIFSMKLRLFLSFMFALHFPGNITYQHCIFINKHYLTCATKLSLHLLNMFCCIIDKPKCALCVCLLKQYGLFYRSKVMSCSLLISLFLRELSYCDSSDELHFDI